MDKNIFYGFMAATCFTLVGLWWSVVKDNREWFQDEVKRRLAGGVYVSFLIPALMSLAAQVGTETDVIWNIAFIIAALAGMYFSTQLIKNTQSANAYGPFSKNRWIVTVLYGIVLLFALFPGLGGLVGLRGLQIEGLLLSILILVAHMLTWEFVTNTK
jgi:hypothetical protein